jgi:hypothetical protein
MIHGEPKNLNIIKDYNKNPKKFFYCVNTLSYPKRNTTFCSLICAAKNNNPIKKNTKRLCLNCNKETKRRQHKYCSNKCQLGLQSKNKLNLILTGKIPGTIEQTQQISRTLRAYILKKQANYQCEFIEQGGNRCCWKELRAIDIHHSDGNANNNRSRNLQVLCKNHHALTPNYGNKNNGNGRLGRRELYQKFSNKKGSSK